MAKKGLGGVISGSIVLFLGAIIITAGVGARFGVNKFLIEPMIDDSIQGIEDMALAELTPAIDTMAYTMVLPGILEQMQYAFGGDPENLAAFINGSTSAQLVYTVANGLHPAPYADLFLALTGLFNDNILSIYGTPIPGISEALNGGVSLGYTPAEVTAICFGGTGTSWNGIPFAGILEEDPLGDMTPGILVFFTHLNAAAINGSYMGDMMAAYGVGNPALFNYVYNYFDQVIYPQVPNIIGQQLEWAVPAATADTVDDYILAQWAEKILFPDGLGALDPLATNFEVGTNFTSLAQVQGVWASVTDEVGINRWFAHDPSLATELSLNTTEFAAVDAWVATVKPTLFGGIAYNFGFPNDNHYVRLLLGQWIVPGFLPGYEAGLIEGIPFEINMTEPLDSDTAVAIWEDLKSEEDVIQWYNAVDIREGLDYINKKAEHGLTDVQMEEICDYLGLFRDEVVFELNKLQPPESQISLPIWGTEIGKALDDIGLYVPIGGGVFAAAGILLIALFARKRV